MPRGAARAAEVAARLDEDAWNARAPERGGAAWPCGALSGHAGPESLAREAGALGPALLPGTTLPTLPDARRGRPAAVTRGDAHT